MTPAPVLIALPDGLNVSGVTTWAVRLANALVAAGRAVGLVVHREPPGQQPIAADIHAGVRLFDLRHLPRFGDRPGDLSPFIPSYREAVEAMRKTWPDRGRNAGRPAVRDDLPVIFVPSLHGDCFGVGAALCRESPASLRVVGWQHADIPYDRRVLEHYAPVLSACVAVSETIERRLHTVSALRHTPIVHIHPGVEAGSPDLAARRPSPPPLRLLYAGRLERAQKRIMALAHVSDVLTARGVPHAITVAGDGPAATALARAAAARPALTLCGPLAPAAVCELLGTHHLFVLPSRYEGLSVAVLEAMACACVPVVAWTASGADQAIAPGTGLIVDIPPDADEPAAGEALGQAIARLNVTELVVMGERARQRVAEQFSILAHARRVSALVDAVAASPPRFWPDHLPCAFTSTDGAGSGTVPPDAPARMAAVLAALAGRRVAIHGTGAHTRALRHVIERAPACVVAFADDDPQRWGATLWHRPVVAPAETARTGATDVVISSFLHEPAVWSRREIYERVGLRVHRLYGTD